MNKSQKEVIQAQLNNEKQCLEALEEAYQGALDDIDGKIADLIGRNDADLQHVIYQVQYQEALKKQMEASLEILRSQNFETVSQYLTTCYEEGFLGTMYDLQTQGVPLIFPIEQEQVVDAITHDTKLSTDLYTALGKDMAKLKKNISAEISRGISTGMTYTDIAKNVATYAGISKSNATRIARTEGHRISSKASLNACERAKSKGADVVKQWDATLDGRTRPSHRAVDGEVRELEETFSNGLMYPSDPNGGASESINCRCVLLQRARWAVKAEQNDGFTKAVDTDDGTQIVSFKDVKNYDEFKTKYWDMQKSSAVVVDSTYKDVVGSDKIKYIEGVKEEYQAYARSKQIGELSPLASFELYQSTSKEINDKLVGITTQNGIEVASKSDHFIARILGSVEDRRNGVSVDEALSIIQNPDKISDIKYSKKGNPSQRFSKKGIGSVTINPETGNLIQVNPLGRSKK